MQLLWRHTKLADKMEASHHTERLKQASQIVKAGAEPRVNPARLAASNAGAAEVDSKAPDLSVLEAATQAALFFEYCMDRRHGGHMCEDMVDTFCMVV